LEPRSVPMASTSACSRRMQSRSTCCCSTRATARGRQESSLSTRRHTAPITTGTSSSRALKAGQAYAYRAHGPYTPERGLRFDGEKVLLDPYGLTVAVPDAYDRGAADRPGDNAPVAMKSVVADPNRYYWERDRPLQRPFADTVIYELHVRGLTRHPTSGVETPKSGTYAGLIEEIPHLKDLGVTAVELLPIFQFDPQDAPEGRANYWRYGPVSFFAPHHAYGSGKDPLAALDEFWDMVKALHRAGNRDHPRRRVQPHGGRRRRRVDLLLSAPRQRLLLYPRAGIALRRLQRVRQHVERQPTDRAPDDPGQPASPGDPDARRRVPLRSGNPIEAILTPPSLRTATSFESLRHDGSGSPRSREVTFFSIRRRSAS
jgi:hypothetical protein